MKSDKLCEFVTHHYFVIFSATVRAKSQGVVSRQKDALTIKFCIFVAFGIFERYS